MKKTSQFPPFLQNVGKLLRARSSQAPQFIIGFVDNLMFTDRLDPAGHCGHFHLEHRVTTVQCKIHINSSVGTQLSYRGPSFDKHPFLVPEKTVFKKNLKEIKDIDLDTDEEYVVLLYEC